MVTPTFDISESNRVSAARPTRADGESLRYRLDVVAASAVDVVQSAGGWLYDRVMAGWEVTVLLPQAAATPGRCGSSGWGVRPESAGSTGRARRARAWRSAPRHSPPMRAYVTRCSSPWTTG